MEKRLGLAIGLSLLVMVAWSLIANPQNNKNQALTEHMPSAASPSAVPVAEPAQVIAGNVFHSSTAAIVRFDAPRYEIIFDEQRAGIKEIIFKDGLPYTFHLNGGFFVGEQAWEFKKEQTTAQSISFRHSDNGLIVLKTFYFSNSKYGISLDVIIKNESAAPVRLRLPVVLATLDTASSNPATRFYEGVLTASDKIMRSPIAKPRTLDRITFAAIRDQYFCAVLAPQSGVFSGWITKPVSTNTQIGQIGMTSEELVIMPGEQIGQKFEGYAGPQDVKQLSAVKPAWAAIVHYGIFDVISQVLLQILGWLHHVVHNWGIAIILLSLVIYAVLFPLTAKQMRAMKDMQAIQPKVEAVRVQYKDNPQRMNKEIMELYKHHKVNPIGGCLPVVLQMPIFFALYQALMRSAQLRGANFLWIKDLSSPDKLIVLPKALPVIGSEINLLPILMTIGMFFQQKLSMSSMSGQQAEQQRMMLIVFPIIFCFIFYHMPSGLVLYWFINSGLMLINQLRMKK